MSAANLRSLAAALCALAAAGCGVPHPAPAPPAGPTPIESAPHAPGWSANDIRGLTRGLRDALGVPQLSAAGLVVVDAQGRTLFARRERTPMIPASSFKVLVGATALIALGPQHRFTTTLETLASPRAGVIDGDLYLVGGGDPTLTRDDLRGGIAALHRAGVRAVTGSVVGDASAFGGAEINPGWLSDDLQYGYAAGTSALSLDQGTVEFHVLPGTPGTPARIVAVPRSGIVRVLGGVVTSYATLLQIQRDPVRNTFTFSGRVAAGSEPVFWRPIVDAPLYAADVARTMLRERNVVVAGIARAGSAPTVPFVMWRHRSAPLGAIVPDMMRTSNNHFAEQLLRAVGSVRGAGTEAGGEAVERAVLARQGVPVAGLRVVDGSGLAPGDRVAPLTLAMLLARTALEPVGATFVASLPRVGIEGTVRYHHLGDALGRARAKSGHIENVNALTGYVATRRHGRVAFAFLVNDRRADDGPVYVAIDRALDLLART